MCLSAYVFFGVFLCLQSRTYTTMLIALKKLKLGPYCSVLAGSVFVLAFVCMYVKCNMPLFFYPQDFPWLQTLSVYFLLYCLIF